MDVSCDSEFGDSSDVRRAGKPEDFDRALRLTVFG